MTLLVLLFFLNKKSRKGMYQPWHIKKYVVVLINCFIGHRRHFHGPNWLLYVFTQYTATKYNKLVEPFYDPSGGCKIRLKIVFLEPILSSILDKNSMSHFFERENIIPTLMITLIVQLYCQKSLVRNVI